MRRWLKWTLGQGSLIEIVKLYQIKTIDIVYID